ncbi:MAG: hypothetical protein U9O53_05980 [archaeon]|nr:hypothetical protein [archaeon]
MAADLKRGVKAGIHTGIIVSILFIVLVPFLLYVYDSSLSFSSSADDNNITVDEAGNESGNITGIDISSKENIFSSLKLMVESKIGYTFQSIWIFFATVFIFIFVLNIIKDIFFGIIISFILPFLKDESRHEEKRKVRSAIIYVCLVFYLLIFIDFALPQLQSISNMTSSISDMFMLLMVLLSLSITFLIFYAVGYIEGDMLNRYWVSLSHSHHEDDVLHDLHEHKAARHDHHSLHDHTAKHYHHSHNRLHD